MIDLSSPIERSVYVGIAVILVAVGFVHGIQLTVITVEVLSMTIRVVFVEAVTSILIFVGFVLLAMGLLLLEFARGPSRRGFRDDGDRVTAVVPVYRDHHVLDRSVTSLRNSRYDNLDVLIVCEPDDERSIEIAEDLAEADGVEYLVNGYAGSKAGAINYAVEHTDSPFIAVFDADEQVEPSFISAAMYWLGDGDYDVFQGRRIPHPDGPIETLSYCERVIFHASYKLVELAGFHNCRSSSTVFAREAFETVGGYDDMLTEDLAFAHKCFRNGIRVRHDRTQCNRMEAPHTLRDLWGQRKRWRIGQIEVLHESLLGSMRGPIDRRYAMSMLRIVSSLAGSLFTLMLLSKFAILLFLDLDLFYLLPLISVWCLTLAVAGYDRRRAAIPVPNWSILLAPVIFPAFGLLTIKAIIEYGLRWEGEWYRVQKTGI